MRVRFIGSDEPGEDAVCVVFGMTFPRGEWVEVDNAKLAANPAFEVDIDGDDGPDLNADELKAELDRRGVKYHHKAGPAKLKALLDGDL
jgi:hypothetical protein